MMLHQLASKLVEVCKEQGLDYDERVLPVKLTADCYIFYAVPLNDKCVGNGDCQVKQYYALTGGETIKIVDD